MLIEAQDPKTIKTLTSALKDTSSIGVIASGIPKSRNSEDSGGTLGRGNTFIGKVFQVGLQPLRKIPKDLPKPVEATCRTMDPDF
jgi:hypothetical protein